MNNNPPELDDGFGPTLQGYLQKDMPQVLWHYTDLSAAKSILHEKKLRAWQIGHYARKKEFDIEVIHEEICKKCEDPSYDRVKPLLVELGASFELLLNIVEDLDLFIISFTSMADSTYHWERFCSKGGCAIGFPTNALVLNPPMIDLYPCVYDESDQLKIINESIDNTILKFDQLKIRLPGLTDEQIIYNMIGRLQGFRSWFAMLKKPCYQNENEWRLIVSSPRNSMKHLLRSHNGSQYIEIDFGPVDFHHLWSPGISSIQES